MADQLPLLNWDNFMQNLSESLAWFSWKWNVLKHEAKTPKSTGIGLSSEFMMQTVWYSSVIQCKIPFYLGFRGML